MNAPSASTRLLSPPRVPRRALAPSGERFAEEHHPGGPYPAASLAPVVGAGTVRRLRALHTGGRPVLSLYLDAPGATPDAGTEALTLLARSPELAQGGEDVERVRRLLGAMPALPRAARGLAVFSSVAASLLEVVPLPCEVRPQAALDTMPWLEPLAGMCASGAWGAAVLGPHTLRLFRGGPRMLVEYADVHDDPPAILDAGGRSPHSPRRHLHVTERQAAWRVERAAALLARAQQRGAHEHLVVAAPHELWPLVERTLHSDLRARLDGLVGPGLERASAQDIARAAGAVVARAEHEEDGRCACSTTTLPSLRCERVDARPTTSRYTSGLSVPAGPPARTCTSGGGYAARTPGSRSSRGW